MIGIETLVTDCKRPFKHPARDPRRLDILKIAALPFPPEPHERGRFYLVLSEFHEVTFPNKPYNFVRLNDATTAARVARTMALRTGQPFHVLEHVGGFRKAGGEIERFAGDPEWNDEDVTDGRGFPHRAAALIARDYVGDRGCIADGCDNSVDDLDYPPDGMDTYGSVQS